MTSDVLLAVASLLAIIAILVNVVLSVLSYIKNARMVEDVLKLVVAEKGDDIAERIAHSYINEMRNKGGN